MWVGMDDMGGGHTFISTLEVGNVNILLGSMPGPLLAKREEFSSTFFTSIVTESDLLEAVVTGSVEVGMSSVDGGGGNLSVSELPLSEGVRRSPG